MIVHKTVKVDVGTGHPGAIIDALRESPVPEKAVATSVSVNWSEIVVDYLMTSVDIATGVVMTFEWDDEE